MLCPCHPGDTIFPMTRSNLIGQIFLKQKSAVFDWLHHVALVCTAMEQGSLQALGLLRDLCYFWLVFAFVQCVRSLSRVYVCIICWVFCCSFDFLSKLFTPNLLPLCFCAKIGPNLHHYRKVNVASGWLLHLFNVWGYYSECMHNLLNVLLFVWLFSLNYYSYTVFLRKNTCPNLHIYRKVNVVSDSFLPLFVKYVRSLSRVHA